MSVIKLRDYVVIAQNPDESTMFLRVSVQADHWEYLHALIEEDIAERLAREHPDATPVKGGAGWSEPYDMPLEAS